MIKNYLLGLKWLWRAELLPTFNLQPIHGRNESKQHTYMGMVRAEHRLFPVSYLFTFYWYGNSKSIPTSYKLTGSYDTSLLRSNAIKHCISMSTIKPHDNRSARPQVARPVIDLDDDTVGWRDLSERVGRVC